MASPPRSSPVVPEALRDLSRRKKQREQEDRMEEVRRSAEEESSKNRYSDDDKRSLEDLMKEPAEGYAKGGMVRKKGGHRGDGICVKGHTKGKVY